MALVIDEGPTIWLNPNIWVSEPPPTVALSATTAVAKPQVGHTGGYVMKARIHNNGESAASGYAYYYWAIPTPSGITVGSANLVGDATKPGTQFNMAPGTRITASEHLNPANRFKPAWVNNGHICMSVYVSPSSTPPPKSFVLDPNLSNVAQRNLELLSMSGGLMMFQMGFEMGSPDEEPGKFTLEMVQAPPEELRQTLELFAPDLPLQGLDGQIHDFGMLDFTPCLDEGMLGGARPVLESVELFPYERQGMTLAGILEGDAALVHVIQRRDNGDLVGGLSVIAYRE